MIYDQYVYGHGMAWLNYETLVATIDWPCSERGGKSPPYLIIEELFRLMSRKGAGVVTCKGPKSAAADMASIRFYAKPIESFLEKDEIIYYRYSERFLETIITTN